MPVETSVLVGIVCLVVGAAVAVLVMRNAKNGSVREAESKIQNAHTEAEQVVADAKRAAETLKKEALLEAKEEIIQSKQAAEAAESKIQNAHTEAEQVVADAKRAAETLKKEALLEAKEEIIQSKQAAEAEEAQRKKEIRVLENRVMQREESLDRRNDALDKREHQLSSQQGQIDKRSRELEELYARQTSELERISELTRDDAHAELLDKVRGEVTHEAAAIIRESEQKVKAECHKTAQEIISELTRDDAHAELLDKVRGEVTHEAAAIIRESEQKVKAECHKTAQEIISLAIQRCASDHTAEVTVTSVHIPSDDLKGRIIGREGRNIRTFEQVSGVNLVIDDTPETVVLSSFDPVRRETARVALENLIADGRIHPARIEEMYQKASDLVQQRVREAGEQAAFDTGIHDLHPEIIKTLGALRYRTSFGQNVLRHSLEVADFRYGYPRPASRDHQDPRCASLPHLLWAERSSPLSRGRRPVRHHGLRAWHRRHDRQARRPVARPRQGHRP